MPLRNLEVRAQGFDVRDQVRGGVGAELGEGEGFAGAALVEQRDGEEGRVEEAGVRGGGAAAGAAVEEDDWLEWALSGWVWFFMIVSRI